MTEEIYKSCDICKTDYNDDTIAPFIYNKDKKLLIAGECSFHNGHCCDENMYIFIEDLDISNCCNHCFRKLYEKGIILYNGNCLMEDILDNLNEPIENCSTNYLQNVLNYEEKYVEEIMKNLGKIKDVLKSREE